MPAKAPKKKGDARKSAPKSAPKKSPAKASKKAEPKAAPKAKAAPKGAPKPAPKAAAPKPEPMPEPEPVFVKQASPAERKAALEAILEAQGVEELPVPRATPRPPAPLPPAVRETSPADRKAAVEQLVEQTGVGGVLRNAPWKRGGPVATPNAAAPPTPPTPAPPSPEAPRAKMTMTKAPLEATTGRTASRVVILDSNALMMQFQFHVDIEREVRRILDIDYEVVVPQIVVDELRRLSKEGAQKEAAEARMAVELAKTFKVMESPGDGDTAILRLAEKLNAVVVTNDKKLRARLRAKDLANIYMRSRAFLTLEGHIPGM